MKFTGSVSDPVQRLVGQYPGMIRVNGYSYIGDTFLLVRGLPYSTMGCRTGTRSMHQLSNTGANALFVGETLVFKVTGVRDGRLGADAGIPAG